MRYTRIIEEFRGEYRWLSNFWIHDTARGLSVEHHYQAAKTTNYQDWLLIMSAETPALAKKYGKPIEHGGRITVREDWNIVKTHSNDAVCIADLEPESVDIEEWSIKPMRRKSKAGVDEVCGFRHRDYVSYTYRNGETYIGYVTAMYPEIHALNFQAPTKHCKKVNALKCRLVWRFNKIYWFKCT